MAAAFLCLVTLAASPAAAATTLTVSQTADIAANAGACGNSSTTVPSPLSLREATCLANNIGGTVNIVLPAGHYLISNGELRPGLHSGQTVNISGAGAVSTIIDAQGTSRVLDYDPSIVGGVNASLSGVTITGGHVTSIGGAGIIAGSGHATTKDVLTVDSVVITDNHVVTTSTNNPAGGMAFQGGQLTVSNTTVSNNSSGSSPGSGIYYQAEGDAPGEGMSISNTTLDSNQSNSTVANLHLGGALQITSPQSIPLSVTGSRFTNNTVTGTAGSASGAGILVLNGSLTVTGSIFSGNSVTSTGASASGAAVYAQLGSVTMHYNRIVGNSPASTAVSNETTATPPATIDATKNWWGCNAGPGNSGCDGLGGTGSVVPRLVFSASASPTTVTGPNGTSTITAGFTRDSSSTAVDPLLLGAFSGATVTWSDPTPSPATVNGHTDTVGTTISSGNGQVTYNSQSAAGPGHVVGTFDNQSVTTTLTVNRPPTITSANHATSTVGAAGSFTVTTTAGYPAATTLSEAGTLPSGVSFADQGDGTALLSGTPASGSDGTYPITITASNGVSPNATQSFTLTVQPGAVNDTATVVEDSGANAIDVLANDNSSSSKAVTAKTDGSHGSVSITHSGADLTYTPNANYCGTDTFTYTLNGQSTATVSVTVGCVDDPTVAVDDAGTVTEDAPATTLDVRQNDTDIDSAKELIVSTATGAATHGTVSITHSGADLTYTPAADYCNAGAPNDAAPDATFTYSLSGGASATVSIAVTCVSDPPVISGGGTLSYTENDGPKQVSGALSVVEPEGEAITGATASITAGYAAGQDALTWTDDLGDNISRDISSDAQTLVLTGTGTAAEYQAALRQVSYTNSSDSPDTTDRTVTYTATDASNTTGSGTATVHVAAVNDAPVAADDSYTTDEDTAVTKSAADGVLANDTDADHDPLTATLVTSPAHAASFTLHADGSFDYTPAADYNGSDSFTYNASDGTTDSTSPATVNLTVSSVNDPPVATDDSYTTDEDTALTPAAAQGVLANDTDADNDALAATVVTGPTHAASFTLNADGSFDYTPVADYHGTDSFTYKTNDGTTDSAGPATVDLTINAVDDPPAAVDDDATVSEDAGATAIDVTQNDTDTDAGPKLIESVTQPAHGVVAITGSGTGLTYTPHADYCNTAPGSSRDTFTYTLNGGSTATAALTVTCIDDPPVAVDDHLTTPQDSTATVIDVAANDQDIDGGPKQIASITQPGHGSAALTPDGAAIAYTPTPGYCTAQDASPDTFTYRLNGGSEATVAVTVTCTPDPSPPAGPPPPTPEPPASVAVLIGHRNTALKHGRIELRLTCRQRCAGLLTLTATGRRSRLSAAAASRHRFALAAGDSQQFRMRPTEPILTLLRRRGKAVAKVTVALSAGGPVARPASVLITVTPERRPN